IIREVEPPPPSKRLATGAAKANSAKPLQGELDWIVMRALEKDRSRRYQSAGALADDLTRYLADQPIEAQRPTRRYRLKKFIRRNKWTVLSGLAISLAIITGMVLASIGFVHARQEATRSEQVAQFLKETLAAAGPGVARGRDATLLREILDKTAERIENELKDQPEVQGDLWCTIGGTYAEIGEYAQAIAAYQRAVNCIRGSLGDENKKMALALGGLGRCQSYQLQVQAGSANAKTGLEIARKCGDKATLEACLICTAQSLNWSG